MFMFGLESLLMQATTTSTGNPALDSVIAIVVAVGIVAGIAAPYLKKLNGRVATIGQYADTFSQKTAESQDEMYRALGAARSVIPELDAALKKYEVPLSKIEKRVETAADQLEYFREKIPDKSLAKSVDDLPRESFKVDLRRRVHNPDKPDDGPTGNVSAV
jgi:hypothetical protein